MIPERNLKTREKMSGNKVSDSISERRGASTVRGSACVPTTYSTWLIGSMNECYVEINQDFTKVKTTQTLSWYLDLCITAICCVMPLIWTSISIFPSFSSRRQPLGDERIRESIRPRDASWKSHFWKNRRHKFFKTSLSAGRDVSVES